MFKNIPNIYIGKDLINNFIVEWDLANSGNGSVAMIGSPGFGKSALAQSFAIELVKNGATLFCIDQHRTLSESEIFQPLREDFEKYRNDIYAEEGIPIKLFEQLVIGDGKVERPEITKGAICDILIKALKVPIDFRFTLLEAVSKVMNKDSYKSRGFQAIEDALKEIGTKKAIKLLDRLGYIFLHNPLRYPKDDNDVMIKEGRINIVHLSSLDLTSQELLTEVLASYIWRLGNAGEFVDKNFYFFIDECQNMHTGSSDPLALMISEGRKMGINLILATQMILQGTTNSVQQRLASCGLMIYFRPVANRVRLTAKMISDSDPDTWSTVLSDLGIGEFVAKGNLVLNGKLHVSYPLKVNGYIGEHEGIIKEEIEYTVNGDVPVKDITEWQ